MASGLLVKIEFHRFFFQNEIKMMQICLSNVVVISNIIISLLQPLGCIFQNGFLVEFPFEKKFKNRTFHIPEAFRLKEGYNRADKIVKTFIEN